MNTGAMQSPDGSWMAWGELGTSQAQTEADTETEAREIVAGMLVANEYRQVIEAVRILEAAFMSAPTGPKPAVRAPRSSPFAGRGRQALAWFHAWFDGTWLSGCGPTCECRP